MSVDYTAGSEEFGILGKLPHPDLLTFLSLAQNGPDKLLEYSPRYDDKDRRRGGNAIVQVVHLSNDERTASRLPSFAFKRHDGVESLTYRQQLKKIICELIIYDCLTIRSHSNFAKLEGISWSATDASAQSASNGLIVPVLGFHPSEYGNLADFMSSNVETLSFIVKLKICCDVGHALETLHSLNFERGLTIETDIAHGDLKPENVLIKGFNGKLVAQIIDFDGSSFGLTDSDPVWTSGTKGWTDPELNRGNRTVRLCEAFQADLYSYGRLCAWVIFRGALSIEEYVKDVGRTSVQRCETFDLKGAASQARRVENNEARSFFKRLELECLSSMQDFFSSTFVGCRKRRYHDILEAVTAMERLLKSTETVDTGTGSNLILGLFKILNLPTCFRPKLGLEKRPYNRSRYRITQRFLARTIRVKHRLAGRSQDQELNYVEKQWVYRSGMDFYVILYWLYVVVAWSVFLALLVCHVFFLLELLRFGGEACASQDSDLRYIVCFIGMASTPLIAWWLIPGLLFAVGFLLFIALKQIRRYLRAKPYEDEMFELTDANIRQVGSQVASGPALGSLKGMFKYIMSHMEDIPSGAVSRKNEDLLRHLADGGNSCHLFPDLIRMSPLLSRLDHRVRQQVVADLHQRLNCPGCCQQAKELLSVCALIGIGKAETDGAYPQKPASVTEPLEWALQADLDYRTSLPQLPYEIRNQMQEGRADLYTFSEMPTALGSIMTELSAKLRTGLHFRSTQILCATLGRLFALLGRHQEASMCFYVSMTHRAKPRWRTYDKISLRMHDYAQSSNGDMETRRRRDQLLEAEHDLFLFSLVNELIILGQGEEAIQEMQAVRDIGVAPNGLYLERETGRSFKYVWHRVADARNLLMNLLLDKSMLIEIEGMKQEYDLADTIGGDHLGETPTPEQAVQCFVTTERVATLLYQSGRFEDAIRVQRRLLAQCSKGRIHKRAEDIQLLRQALALSLSRCENIACVEEASAIQDELHAYALENDREASFSLRLNQTYTLRRLNHLRGDCEPLQRLLKDDRAWMTTMIGSYTIRDTEPGKSFVWLHGIPGGLRTAAAIQHALLATTAHLQAEDQTQLMTILCTSAPTSDSLHKYEELINFFQALTLRSNASVTHHLMLWDRLICLLLYVATTRELPKFFDDAQLVSVDMTNYVSIMSYQRADGIRATQLRNLILRAKAQYLNAVGGFGNTDLDFWKSSLRAHRDGQENDFGNDKENSEEDPLPKKAYAAMLKERVIAFCEESDTEELCELHRDIDYKTDCSLAARVEHAHAVSILNLINPSSPTQGEDTLRFVLRECEITLGPSHPLTSTARTRLSKALEQHDEPTEACTLLSEVVTHTVSMFGCDHPQTLRARFNLLKLQYSRASQLELHEYSYLPGLSELRYTAARVLGKDHATTQAYLGAYAFALERDKKAVVEAIQTKRKVVETLSRTSGLEHSGTIQEMSELAGMLCRRGGEEHAEGRLYYKRSLRSAAALYGVSHPKMCAAWKDCVSAIVAPDPSNERAPSANQTMSSFKVDGEPVPGPPNSRRICVLHSDADEILLSRNLLGADHSFTLEIQQKNPISTRQCACDNSMEPGPTEGSFPIPPTRQLAEQWNVFMKPLYDVYQGQREDGLEARRKALEAGNERFEASGGIRLEYLDSSQGT